MWQGSYGLRRAPAHRLCLGYSLGKGGVTSESSGFRLLDVLWVWDGSGYIFGSRFSQNYGATIVRYVGQRSAITLGAFAREYCALTPPPSVKLKDLRDGSVDPKP